MIELIKGDCLVEMQNIADGSIDCIICDLPYGTLKCKWDIIIPFDKLWKQYERIIKNDGVVVLFSTQPFTSKLLISNINLFKQELIWVKNRPTNIFQLKNAFGNVTENILIFSKSGATSHCKNPMVYNPQNVLPNDNYGHTKLKKESVHLDTGKTKRYKMTGANYPINTLEYKNTIKDRKHPTQKPIELIEYLVKTYSNENDTILDNTMGSGTTGVACKNLNRNFIGIELDDKYFEIAEKRINETQVQTKLF